MGSHTLAAAGPSTGTASSRRHFVRAAIAGAATVATAPALGGAAAAATTTTSGGGLAPIQTVRTAGDRLLLGGGWGEVEVEGNATARPLDLVLPGVAAGDWVRLTLSGRAGTEPCVADFTFFSVVRGSRVNPVGGGNPVSCWSTGPLWGNTLSGTIAHQLRATDIDAGIVRFRLHHRVDGVKTIYGSTSAPLLTEVAGPFA